jgi:hypothetical protein
MRTLGVDTISITTPELESISDNIAPLFCEEFTHDLTLQVFTQMDKSMDWLSSHKSNNIRVRKKSLFI